MKPMRVAMVELTGQETQERVHRMLDFASVAQQELDELIAILASAPPQTKPIDTEALKSALRSKFGRFRDVININRIALKP